MSAVSGGQGENETETEAAAMLHTLKFYGIDPARIYIEDKATDTIENLTFSAEIIDSQEFENHTFGSLKIIPPDEWKSYSNNTEINNTDINKTNPILSAEAVDKDEDERASYYEYFKEQLCFEALLIDHPYDKDMLEEILELIVDTVCSKRKQIRIAGDDKPVNVVKSSFMKLDKSHIDYVLSCMKESSPDIRNIKQYILAALYNAPMTIGNYYQAMYNNDHANGLI